MSMRQESERGFMVQIAASAIIRVQVECHAIDADAAQEYVEGELDAIQANFAKLIAAKFNTSAGQIRLEDGPAPLKLLFVTVDHDPKAEVAEVEDVQEL